MRDQNILASKTNAESRLPDFLLVIVLLGAFFFYVALITPETFGLYYDDAIYLAAAKSLATGQGYHFISLPHEPPQTEVPPFYPFLLSLIWRVNPNFPNNVGSMLAVSVVATVGFLGLVWVFFVRENYASRWQALLIVFLVGINVRTMMLATAILTETLYTSLSILGLFLAERRHREKRGWISGLLLGLVIGLAFLTRSTGLALFIAICVYYVVRRDWGRLLLPSAVGGSFVLAWFYWCLISKSAVEGVNSAYYSSYLTSISDAITHLQALNHTSALTTLVSIMFKNFFGLIVISIPLECLNLHYFGGNLVLVVIVFLTFAVTTMGFIKSSSSGVRLLHIYVTCYLLLQIIRPYARYERFLMPILPFLLLFLTIGLGMLISSMQKEIALGASALKKMAFGAISTALALAVAASLFNYGAGVYSWLTRNSSGTLPRPILDNRQAIQWVNNNTNMSDVLLCSRESMYYLYTGRKATRYFPINLLETSSFQSNSPTSGELIKLMLDIAKESKGQYLIITASDAEFECDPCRTGISELVERWPSIFTAVFKSTDGRSSVYRIESSD